MSEQLFELIAIWIMLAALVQGLRLRKHEEPLKAIPFWFKFKREEKLRWADLDNKWNLLIKINKIANYGKHSRSNDRIDFVKLKMLFRYSDPKAWDHFVRYMQQHMPQHLRQLHSEILGPSNGRLLVQHPEQLQLQ